MKVFLKNGSHIFYMIETGKITSINIERNWVKNLACVPSIYAKDLTVITEEEFNKAKKQTGL